MPTAFAKAFQNKAKAAFGKAKSFKHRAGNSFIANVADGSYTANIQASVDVGKKGAYEGVPIVRFTATINDGISKGEKPVKAFFCEGKPVPPDGSDEMPTAEQQLLGLIGFLLPDYDVSEMELDQLEDALSLINQRNLVCEIGVVNKVTSAGKKVQNVYFNKLRSPVPEDDSTEADATDDDSDIDDFQEFDAPAKGDTVTVEGKDGEWTVASVSQERELVTLTNEDGDRLRNISWADIKQID